jgi:hypothetical protein
LLSYKDPTTIAIGKTYNYSVNISDHDIEFSFTAYRNLEEKIRTLIYSLV